MATNTDPVAGSEVAELLIGSIGSQADLLWGLSAAICGGVVALVIQIAIHNHGDDTKKITIVGSAALLFACVAEIVSMYYGYYVRGTLVGSVPALYAASYLRDAPLILNNIEAVDVLQYYAKRQFYWFLGGLCLLLPLVVFNRGILKST